MTLSPCPDCGAPVRLEFNEWCYPLLTPWSVCCTRCTYDAGPRVNEKDAVAQHEQWAGERAGGGG